MNKRDQTYVVVCPNCQCERFVSYCQNWNLEKGINRKECRPCRIELGLQKQGNPPRATKESQYKTAISRTGIKRESSKKVMVYRSLFNNESLRTPDMKAKQRNAKLGKFGESANAWDGGKVNGRKLESSRDEYKQLRKDCFSRDNFTCTICNVRGGNLEMDHIKEWCNYPELRYEISNVRTLCRDCHKNTDNYSYKAIKKREVQVAVSL